MRPILRNISLAHAVLAALTMTPPLLSQQAFSPAASTLIQNSQTALVPGGVPVTDITLIGTVEFVAGSTDETGTIKMIAMTDGSSRVDISLAAGTTSESSYISESRMKGESRDAKGKHSDKALHNMMSETAWFCPAMLMQHFASFGQQGWVSTKASENTVTSNSQTLVLAKQVSTGSSMADAEIKRLSQSRISLDSSSSLPNSYKYETHPALNSKVNISIEVRFSAYAPFSGVMIPMHIEKYVNGVLLLDISVNSVTINSGLSSSSFHLN